MKRVLFISPDFPPPETIAGITASRLAQHLPAAGWEVEVVRRASFEKRKATPSGPPPKSPGQRPEERFAEWLPFGDSITDLPQMRRDSLVLHRKKPFDVILTRSAPVTAAIAGHLVARATGLPVVHMHGDPWGPCDQRASIRPFWTKALEGWAERTINRRTAGLILNTETARADYLTAFPFLTPETVHSLRSPVADDALRGEDAPGFDAPTLLFPGSFTKRVPSAPILRLAEALHGVVDAEIAVTNDPGAAPEGASVPLHHIGRVPQAAMASLMDQADILIAISQPTPQRIPQKLSDFLISKRPVLVLEQAPNPEMRAFVEAANMGAVFALNDLPAAAAWVADTLSKGRKPAMPRTPSVLQELSIAATVGRLSDILDHAIEPQK